jgi:tRNA threonylcarbamoyladenosine biosynthesis protein TsaE
MEWELASIKDINTVAKSFLAWMETKEERIFAFSGEMAVGKTSFISALCKEMGVVDEVCSPSFPIVNQYATSEGEAIYHFDAYRIKSLKEFYDIGYEEYFFSGNYCFIEWPEKIKELLPENSVYIKITNNNGVRTIKNEAYE